MKKIIVLSFLLFITISKFTLSEVLGVSKSEEFIKAEKLYDSEKYLEAKKEFEKIAQKNTLESGEAYSYLAEISAINELRKDRQNYLLKAVENGYTDSFYGLTESYLMSNEVYKIEPLITKLLTKYPNDPKLSVQVASYYYGSHQIDKAIEQSKKLLKLGNKEEISWANFLLGNIYVEQKKYDLAEKYYLDASDPNELNVHLINFYNDQKEYDKMIKYIYSHKYINESEKIKKIYDFLKLYGEHEVLIKYLSDYISKNPKSYFAYHFLGRVYEHIGNLDKAEKMYEIATNEPDYEYDYVFFMEDRNKQSQVSKFVDSKISVGNFNLAIKIINYYIYMENKDFKTEGAHKIIEYSNLIGGYKNNYKASKEQRLERALKIIEYSNKIKKYKNDYKDIINIEGALGYAYYITKKYDLAEENLKIALENTIKAEELAMYNYYIALMKKNTGNSNEYEYYLFRSYELDKNNEKILNKVISFYEIKGNKKLADKYKKELKKITN
ncbi:MAG: tetratricopeptide repeat protein [Leptotrichiaceae bacterium]|nr:tetratricopeptide repeat protein [Leptotrichiaceae bacterium]MBP9629638.1 tetratricopeptide repeat protein [Leptotrichiaceae bacterium]